MKTKIETVNLYGENGITIGLTAELDIVAPEDPDATLRVVGHRLYACSADEAEVLIQQAYIRQSGLYDSAVPTALEAS